MYCTSSHRLVVHIRALQLQHILAWKAAQAFTAGGHNTTVDQSSIGALRASSLITATVGFAYMLAQLFRSCFSSITCVALMLIRHMGSAGLCSFNKAACSVQHVLSQTIAVLLTLHNTGDRQSE